MVGRKIVPGSSFSIADRWSEYNGNGRKITIFDPYDRGLRQTVTRRCTSAAGPFAAICWCN
jgi:hypothetical protein